MATKDIEASPSDIIPELSKSQQKKASRKAKDKKTKEDKKKVDEEVFKKTNVKEPRTKFDFLKKDLMKCKLIEEDIEDQFSFGDVCEDGAPDVKTSSKFFRKVTATDEECK